MNREMEMFSLAIGLGRISFSEYANCLASIEALADRMVDACELEVTIEYGNGFVFDGAGFYHGAAVAGNPLFCLECAATESGDGDGCVSFFGECLEVGAGVIAGESLGRDRGICWRDEYAEGFLGDAFCGAGEWRCEYSS